MGSREKGSINIKVDGYTYFDSLAFVGAANAEAHFSAVYTTPIGVDIIGEMDATGKAAIYKVLC